jgi:PAS domain-containing protein
LDREWRFTAYNIAAESIFRMPRIEVIVRLLWEVSPLVKGTEFDRRYRIVMEHRTREEFESYSVLCADQYLEVRAFPFDDGVGVAVRDITERQSVKLALCEREMELARVQRIGGHRRTESRSGEWIS